MLKTLSAESTREELLAFLQQYGSHYVSEALYGSELSCSIYFPSKKAQQQLWLQYQKGERAHRQGRKEVLNSRGMNGEAILIFRFFIFWTGLHATCSKTACENQGRWSNINFCKSKQAMYHNTQGKEVEQDLPEDGGCNLTRD